MMKFLVIKRNYLFLLFFLLTYLSGCHITPSSKIGIFEQTIDVGDVLLKGASHFHAKRDVYTLKGAGTNMWFDEDEFHFLWRKVDRDFVLQTQMEWVGDGASDLRKAGLIIRENFDPGSRYVSAALHGNRLTSMQYRLVPDSATLEQTADLDFLSVLQLEKKGNLYCMKASKPGDILQEIGNILVPFDSTELYVGLFICSHNPEIREEVRFRNTRLTFTAPDDFVPYRDYIGSRLETVDIESGNRLVVYQSDQSFEAPNWSKNGDFWVVNRSGKFYRIDKRQKNPKEIDTQFAIANNNDHGISPDGQWLAISHHVFDRHSGQNSIIYTVPISGGTPVQVTQNSPSYWHGWSPDGKYLIYTGHRNNQWNIYRISIAGGEEEPLTATPFLDDGSEYAPDGQSIWFNSNRTGRMEIWRMNADGSEQTQITHDHFQNWFPHPSPDGKSLVFLSYPEEINSWDHPYYQHAMIRLMNLETGEIRVLVNLYGGQGSLNVPSWSPDSKKIAFVSNSDLLE